MPLTSGTPKKISTSPGSDSTPLYSPDGKWIAWRSQARAGFESDKFSLIIYDRQTGQARDVTKSFDNGVDSIAWAADSKSIFFTAEDHGQSPIYALAITDQGTLVSDLVRLARRRPGAVEGRQKSFLFEHDDASPSEIAKIDLTGWLDLMTKISAPYAQPSPPPSQRFHLLPITAKPVTHVNDKLLAQLELNQLEPFTFKGAENADVQGFLLKPRVSMARRDTR